MRGRAWCCSLAVLVAATGCGSSGPLPPSPVATATRVAPTTTPNVPPPHTVSPAAADLNIVPNMGIGFTCPLWFDRKGQIVMDNPRAVTDAGTLKSEWLRYDLPSNLSQRSPLPTAMRVVPGAPVSLATNPSDLLQVDQGVVPGCTAAVQVTNVGSAAVQISQASLVLSGPSAPNPRHYDLVDRCSLDGLAPVMNACFGGHGALPGICLVYIAQFTLSTAAAGTRFDQRIYAPGNDDKGHPCPGLTIGPGMTKEIVLNVTSRINLVYPVVALFTVATSTGSKLVAPAELTSTLAFGDLSQFSCWKVSGSQLVEGPSGATVFGLAEGAPSGSLDTDGLIRAGAWCL